MADNKEPKKPTYEELEEENKRLKEQNLELADELVGLRRFASYVRSLKTKADFGQLRNAILWVNRTHKWAKH